MSHDRLDELVVEFHKDLVESIEAFSGTEPQFEFVQVGDALSVRLEQTNDDKPGLVPLLADGDKVLGVSITFRCTWDSSQEFLAIEKSSIGVYPLAELRRGPLFRVEYMRNSPSHLPCAHFHVHAHRDEFTHLLANGGSGSRVAKKRSERGVSERPAYLSDFHFPTGGSRFRPILEDVLESLRVEFGLSTTDRWFARLAEARTMWRKKQLASAIRDSPREALRVLIEELGLNVVVDDAIPEDNKVRLTQS